jgi:hypothetical protein
MHSFLLRCDFFVPADGVRWLVDAYLVATWKTPSPIRVVATYFLSGAPVVLSKESAA